MVIRTPAGVKSGVRTPVDSGITITMAFTHGQLEGGAEGRQALEQGAALVPASSGAVIIISGLAFLNSTGSSRGKNERLRAGNCQLKAYGEDIPCIPGLYTICS